jgi:hypothetical protein
MDVAAPQFNPGREIWLKAGKEMGFDIKDPNGPQTIGTASLLNFNI